MPSRAPYDLLAIVGPTASGKTRRAVELAAALGTEIISGDSRQVYRGMDIGTGKDLSEYGSTAVHLLDIMPAGSKYNLHLFLRDFDDAYRNIQSRGKLPLLCGGSGMYVEAAINGLVLPEVPPNESLREGLSGKTLEELTDILGGMKTLHNTTDVDTEQRAIRAIEIEVWYHDHPEEAQKAGKAAVARRHALIVGVDIPRDERRRRISERLEARLTEGMVAEIEGLLAAGVEPADLIYYGLEYKYVTLYVTGRLGFDEMRKQLETAIHQFAKRQMTWFRGMERRGHRIIWIPWDAPDFTDRVLAELNRQPKE